ncbi:MAG: 30S ribosomal protein S6 [Thermoanaerobaculia bacterium]|nr:30S ribosomal protein S6 [Thermoanaerobaculia bacterium]
MRTYEVLSIVSPQLSETEATDLLTEFRSIAEKSGAKLVSEDTWGRRRLAYPIEKLNEGFYHLWVFEAGSDQLSELDRKMKNSDKVMRHIIVRVDLMAKRAAKLAARNPKKVRVSATPAAVSAPAAPAEPVAPAPAPEAVVEAPATPAAE